MFVSVQYTAVVVLSSRPICMLEDVSGGMSVGEMETRCLVLELLCPSLEICLAVDLEGIVVQRLRSLWVQLEEYNQGPLQRIRHFYPWLPLGCARRMPVQTKMSTSHCRGLSIVEYISRTALSVTDSRLHCLFRADGPYCSDSCTAAPRLVIP